MIQDFDREQLNLDQFLRRNDSPLVKTSSITMKEVRYGEEIIFGTANVGPKAIGRSNLSQDVFLQPLFFEMTDVVQISTGYDLALNDYFFGASWDGTNFYLRRFNAIDMLSPFQDGYSVNIPTVTGVYGVAVYNDGVVVAVDTSSGKKLCYYGLDLAHGSDKTNATPISGKMACDGKNVYWLDKAQSKVRKYDLSDYSLVASYNWPSGTTVPDDVLCWDRKAFYAFDQTNKKIIKFIINPVDNSISIVYNIDYREDVVGIFNFKSYIYFCHKQANRPVAVPMVI